MKEIEKTPKRKAKKLQLDRETLYTLDSSELERVVGGCREDLEFENMTRTGTETMTDDSP